MELFSPWPFVKWGMDILRQFPLRRGQIMFLVVAVDYFTKWIEAEALTNNDRQFTNKKLMEFYVDLGVKSITTLVEHPQTNGQAESASKFILGHLKRRLGNAKGLWVEKLPEII